jgi:NADH-ubiquinone oxidoreductase chain 5
MVTFYFVWFTFILRRLNSFFEIDIKKIIALSTLNQLSLIFITVSNGFYFLRFLHLLTHALFKSLLFFNGGLVIHYWFNSQDYRNYNSFLNSYRFVIFSFFISLFNLIGLIFLSGFFSKDLILESFNSKLLNSIFLFIFFFVISRTFLYSLRLIKICFFSYRVKKNLILNSRELIFYFPLVSLILITIFFRNLFISNFSLFILTYNYFKFIILSYLLSLIVLYNFFLLWKLVNLYYFNSIMILSKAVDIISKINLSNTINKYKFERGYLLKRLIIVIFYLKMLILNNSFVYSINLIVMMIGLFLIIVF